MRKLTFALISLATIASCAVKKTEIHLYTQWMDQQKINRVAEVLSQSGYQVELNDLDIPENIHEPTIVYSPLNSNPSSVDRIIDILSGLGYQPIHLVEFQQDNHAYTSNNVGIYLHGYIPPSGPGLNARAVMKEYYGLCLDADVLLNLEQPNVFKLTRSGWDEESGAATASVTTGLWSIAEHELYLFTNDQNSEFTIDAFNEEQGGVKTRGFRLINKTGDSAITGCNFEYREIVYTGN